MFDFFESRTLRIGIYETIISVVFAQTFHFSAEYSERKCDQPTCYS